MKINKVYKLWKYLEINLTKHKIDIIKNGLQTNMTGDAAFEKISFILSLFIVQGTCKQAGIQV